jgi:hypothetical protein
MTLTPAARALLADLADGYRIEVEDLGGWDGSEYHLRKSKPLDRSALEELQREGMLEHAANGSGNAWISEKGRAAANSESSGSTAQP